MVDDTRKYDTLRYIDNRFPLTWTGVVTAFAAVSLLGTGVFSLVTSGAGDGWRLLALGVLAALAAAWSFGKARELRRSERSADRSRTDRQV